MEEVGKYESIQDRIKRLTKAQSSTPAVNFKEKIEALSAINSTSQDSQKQNMNRLNFVKKRQNSQNNFRTATARQPISNHQRPFDLITNLMAQNTQSWARQTQNQIRKISNQYAIRKSTRESLDEGHQNWDSNGYIMKKNDSVGNIMDKPVQNIMEKYSFKKILSQQNESEQCYDKPYLHDGNNESAGLKRSHGIKKTQMSTAFNRQESGDISHMRSIDEESLKQMIKNQRSRGQQFVLNRKMTTEAVPIEVWGQTPELRSRMITRCNSGILQRVPGRIIKNK